jgi:hypothetical protein
MPVTDISYNYITVSFNAPLGSPPIGYYATATPSKFNNDQEVVVSQTQSTNSPITFTGLISGTTYTINITSIYSLGNTISAGIRANTSAAPPTRLSVTNPNVNSLTVGFTPPLGSTPIGYYVTAIPTSTDNGQTTVITSESTSTLIVMSSLISGTTYDIYVSSVYNTGDVISAVAQGSTLSSPPSNLIITDICYNYLKIGYSISSGSTALGYFATATSRTSGESTSSGTSFSNPLTINNLVSGTTYNVTVSASYSNTSASSTFITTSTPSNPPTITGITDTSYNYLTVTFTAPAGNTPNSFYATAVPVTTDNSQQTVVSSSIYSISPITLYGLISGSTYYVTVSAVYNNGTIASNSVAGNTTSTHATDLILSTPTVYSLTLGFTPPICSPPIGYYVTATPLQRDNYQSIVTTSITTSTSIPIDNLISGTVYDVTVTSYYNTGNVISTSTVQGVTVSNPPTSVTATSLLTNSISIAYLPPIGNTPKSYYAVAIPNSTNNNQVTVSTIGAPTNNLYLTIPGLVSGTIYTIAAYSRYSNGDVSSNNIVLGTASFPPTGLTFVVATISSITISFTPPVGSTPSSYLATTSLGGSGTAVFSATEITITGLSPNTSYPGITITAIYSSGNAVSSSITASTIGLPPTNLTVIDVSVNYITVSFTPTSGSLPNSYTGTTDQGGAGTASSLATTITIFGLDPNTYYTGITVTSVYSGGIVASNGINYYTLGYMATNLLTVSRINSIDLNFTAPLQQNAPLGYFARAVPQTTENGQTTITYPVNVSTTAIPTSNSTIPMNIPGLTSGTIYTITLNSVYMSGNVASPNIIGRTLSFAPTITSITGSNNALTVNFTPPITNTPVIGYYSTATPDTNKRANGQTIITTSRQSPTSSSSTNTINITGLISGSKYGVVVTAVYNSTDLELNATSTDVSGTTLSNSPTITQINQYPVDLSTNSITVYFASPVGYTSPISYNATAVPQTTNNTQTTINVTGISKNATSVIVGNLISGTAYDISMATVYDVGDVSSTVYLGAITQANAPTNVLINTNSSTDPSTNSITVYFTPPIGSLPISYSVLATPQQTTNTQQIVNVTGIFRTSITAVIDNLVSGTTYDVNVISIYNTGSLTSSPVARGNTIINPPTLVDINSDVTDISTNALTVYFIPPIGSLPLTYSATAKPTQTTNTQTTINVTGISRSVTSYQFTGLVSGTTYDVSMSAVYDISTNSTVNFLTGNTIITPPTLVAINSSTTDVSTNALTIYFTPPIGSLPLSYSATAKPEQTTNSQTTINVSGISRGATSYQFTGLVSGTTYDVSMSAVYDISTNSTDNFLIGNTIIKPPTLLELNRTAGDASTNAITVYFTPPIGSLPLSYSATAKPQQTTNTQTTFNITDISRDAESYEFTNLISGSTYDISMSAVYDISTNSTTNFLAGNTLSTAPTLTGINTNTGVDASTNAIKVYFDPPIGSKPLSYLATVTPQTTFNNQDKKTILTIGISDVSFVATGLISGTVYDVSMAAVYNISTNRTTDILPGTTLANSPVITSVVNSSLNQQLVISYSAPNPGSAPIGYSIVATPIINNGQTTVTYPVSPSITNNINTNQITLTGLISGTTYNCVVTAYYDVGGFASTSVAGNTYSSPPTGLSITAMTTTTLTVSFNAPSGTAPLGYIVSASLSGSIVSTTAQTALTTVIIGGTGTTALTAGTTYTVTVTAVYNTSYSGLNSFATVEGTTFGVAATNLSFASASPTSITVNYTPAVTTPNYYSLTAAPTGTIYSQGTVSVTSASPTYTVSGLTPGTPYSITLAAVYTNNNQTIGPVTGNTLSNAATSLSTSSVALTSLDVSFALPTYSLANTNQLFYAYAMPQNGQRSQPNVQTGNVIASSLTNSGISMSGLISGTTYYVYIYSIYDTGNLESTFKSVNTLSNAPTNITQTSDVAYNYINVSVTAPSGSAPINYFASYNTSASATYISVSTQSGTTFNISGLNAGFSYNVRVTAAYETGNLSTVDISGNTTAIPVVINSINSANNALTVNFTAPSLSPVQSLPTGYYAVVIPTSSYLGQQTVSTISSPASGSSTSITVSGLTAGTLYNSIIIYSIFPNTTVNSTASTATTLIPLPTNIILASTALTSITISFTVPSPLTDGLTYFAQAFTTSGVYVMDTSGNGTTTTSATQITLSNLTTNFTYNIFVCAYYSSTIIGKSNTYLEATTSTISPTALYNFNPSFANSISVGFTLVTELGGSAPLNYIANAFVLSDVNHITVVSTVTGNDSPLLLSGLLPGTTYQVQVGAVYSTIGAPSYSAYFNLSTDPGE